APRVGDAECGAVDPPTRPLLANPPPAFEEPSRDRGKRSAAAPWPGCAPGKIDKPLWAPAFGVPAETKKARSVVASSRVPRWAGFAGSPPAAGLFKRRLTGLLSRSPPTGTRPQARAYWAGGIFGRIARERKGFCAREANNLCKREGAGEGDAAAPAGVRRDPA